MTFVLKFIARIVLNGAGLYLAKTYISGFFLTGGMETIIIGAIILALLNTFIRPILRFVSAPLVWITFGFFGLVINMFILWIADLFLTQITIEGLWALFVGSLVIGLANAFF